MATEKGVILLVWSTVLIVVGTLTVADDVQKKSTVPFHSSQVEEIIGGHSHPVLVFYNRVPKTASTSMNKYLAEAIDRGTATLIGSKIYTTRRKRMSELDMQTLDFVALLQSVTRAQRPLPLIFEAHHFYFDVSLHARRLLEQKCSSGNDSDAGFCDETALSVRPNRYRQRRRIHKQVSNNINFRLSIMMANATAREWLSILGREPDAVKYFNIVRQPMERALSVYHYAIRTNRTAQLSIGNAIESGWLSPSAVEEYKTWKDENEERWRKQDPYKDEFMTGVELWTQMNDHQTSFFCGHDTRCHVSDSKWALKRAMKTARERYALVGITEELADLPVLLKCRMPTIFGSLKKEVPMKNVSPRLGLSSSVVDVLESWNARDKRLYDSLLDRYKADISECQKYSS